MGIRRARLVILGVHGCLWTIPGSKGDHLPGASDRLEVIPLIATGGWILGVYLQIEISGLGRAIGITGFFRYGEGPPNLNPFGRARRWFRNHLGDPGINANRVAGASDGTWTEKGNHHQRP